MVCIGLCWIVFAAGCAAPPAPEATATPTAQPAQAPTDDPVSWVLLNPLPEDYTQVETGAEIYRLVCKACHGDRGQGLTEDWLAQWAPKDRNCWQSKCHAENHPSDGFYMPTYVPPVVGPQIALRFPTAFALYVYNKATMPWHAPGTMLEQEYWDVTAYMLYANGVDMEGIVLDATNAETIELR